MVCPESTLSSSEGGTTTATIGATASSEEAWPVADEHNGDNAEHNNSTEWTDL